MTTLLRTGRFTVAAMVLAALIGAPGPLNAASGSPRSPEYLIKAAYLYNFAMFVEWPADAFASSESPIVIGVVGSDPFGWALDRTVQDKRIGKRRIVVERLTPTQDPRHAHIVFVGDADNARLNDLNDRLKGASTLVVTDDQAGQRSAIAFVVTDNKVGFEVNLEPARRARVTISSKLLTLARTVR
jgi:hypothetical protein